MFSFPSRHLFLPNHPIDRVFNPFLSGTHTFITFSRANTYFQVSLQEPNPLPSQTPNTRHDNIFFLDLVCFFSVYILSNNATYITLSVVTPTVLRTSCYILLPVSTDYFLCYAKGEIIFFKSPSKRVEGNNTYLCWSKCRLISTSGKKGCSLIGIGGPILMHWCPKSVSQQLSDTLSERQKQSQSKYHQIKIWHAALSWPKVCQSGNPNEREQEADLTISLVVIVYSLREKQKQRKKKEF